VSGLAGLLVKYRRVLRVIFWVYAAALFTATHWPALVVNVPGIERPDLIAHFGCFGGWFGLFWLTGYAGEPLRLRSILISTVVACLYAGLDEGLQAIPWVRRTCAWDDYGANCTGIGIATMVAIVTMLVAGRGAKAVVGAEKRPIQTKP
jgi:hypothetical protein